MQGKVDGKKGAGKKKKFWLRNINELTNIIVEDLFRPKTESHLDKSSQTSVN